jgi:uncharacterized protein YggT (Ycf19 family)
MRTTAIKVARGLLWLVYLWVAITLVLLALAFFLQLFGASPTAGFVQWVYRSTQRAMAPFRGIFEPIPLSDQSVLDVSVLFAMIVYLFVALGLHAAIDWVTGRIERDEYRQRQQDLVAAQRGPDRVVQLAGPSGVAANAVLSARPTGTAIGLTAAGLDPSQTYSVWLAGRDGTRASAGVFQPGPTGTAQLSLTTFAALADSQSIGLSVVSPAGESAGIDVLVSPLA